MRSREYPFANNSHDTETTIRLYFEILSVLKLKGPMSIKEVATCLHMDRKRVRNCLGLLTRKRFIKRPDRDGRTNYRVTLLGNTFLDNLKTLMRDEIRETSATVVR